jgi:hypothetical protein
MNARTSLAIPAFGELIEGGLFHGILLLNGHVWGEVTAPKALEIVGPWHTEYTDVAGAKSDFDGLANTIAMAEAGSELAKQLRTLQHEGLGNWYLPARGGQLMQFANLKPLLEESEAFEDAWYWSSTQTQFSRSSAYIQHFGNGSTNGNNKSWEDGRARPVRRFLIG